MQLDVGIAVILRRSADGRPGDRPSAHTEEIYRSPYGERVVGMSRFYTAKQANDRVDMMVRIARPDDPAVEIHADDLCELSRDGKTYRILQAQYIRDDEAGMDCIDLSLERIGEKLERP